MLNVKVSMLGTWAPYKHVNHELLCTPKYSPSKHEACLIATAWLKLGYFLEHQPQEERKIANLNGQKQHSKGDWVKIPP